MKTFVYRRLISASSLLLGMLIMLAATSCRQDENETPVIPKPAGNETATMTFTLNIPGFREAKTRAGVQETTIENIAVLIFADEGGTEKVKVKHVLPSTALKAITGVQNGYSFSIPITGGTYTRVALVANAETELSTIVVGSTYAELQNLEAINKFGQLGVGTDSSIPMYGEYAPAGGFQLKPGLSQTIAQEIPLIRMLARVDIINNSTATVGSKVYFINAAKNGRIWTNAATFGDGGVYLAPTLPPTLNYVDPAPFPPEGTPANATNVITYYLNEQPATSTQLTVEGYPSPAIIIELFFEGKKYYYRLNYTWDGKKGGGVGAYERGKYMPILRNHRYIFKIMEVKGPGNSVDNDMYETLWVPEEFTNRKLVVHTTVIDETFTDIVFNSRGDYLAVSRTSMKLRGKHEASSTENHFSIRTDHHQGWRIMPRNMDGTAIPYPNPWLQTSATYGNANVTSDVQALTNGKGFKNGYLEVRAGRLMTKVNVQQIGKMPLEYMAEWNLAGGAQYGSIPTNVTPTAAQTDAAFRWATNHDNDQSGYYNWYVCTGTFDATYNPATKNLFNDAFFTTGAGKGYHLPSRWEWRAIFCHTGWIQFNNTPVDVVNINEPNEWGGMKNTYANDFYCTGGSSRICYALRYKQATADPYDVSVTEFPRATDNVAACAFRYELIITPPSIISQLKVQCVYVGDQDPLPDLKTVIAQESWWNSQPAGKVITRILPAPGYIFSNSIVDRGEKSWHWSSSSNNSNSAWLPACVYFGVSFRYEGMYIGLPVRLFANE